MKHQSVLVLDFGGQYNQLIARRIREKNVYCEVHPYSRALEKIKKMDPIGIVLTGGPNSVNAKGAPFLPKEVFEKGIPILGICYGAQLMAVTLGGSVSPAAAKEYGKTPTQLDIKSPLFDGMEENSVTWMSHTDCICALPDGFVKRAEAANCPYAAMEDPKRKLYAVQFHPEVRHTKFGEEMISHFLYRVCGAKGDWKMADYKDAAIERIRREVGDGKVLLALSGGVDSSVAAALLSKAIGKQLSCVFVDHGLLRKDEAKQVCDVFSKWDLTFIPVDRSDAFLRPLAGVSDPEQKRKIIGEAFIRVFEEEAKKIGKVDFLAQGTIYPDVIESGLGDAAVIKSHHNVGGLPDVVDFKKLIEPLRLLFKDEVRALGLQLGLPEELVNRQPFPGPGLAIRIIGSVTREKIALLQEADFILRDEIQKAGLHNDIHQYFAVLTNIRSVGVMGDMRTYDYTIALRAVTTDDFMTADFARIPYDLLAAISNRIVNQVKQINRVVYDVTTKPPATIEWE